MKMPTKIFNQNRIIFMYHQDGNRDPSKMGHVVYNYKVFENYDDLGALLDGTQYNMETMYREDYGMCQTHRNILMLDADIQDNPQIPRYGSLAISRLLPWKTMQLNDHLLDKFFSAGYYDKKVVKIPGSFIFKKFPSHLGKMIFEELPKHLVVNDILPFLNVEDQLNVSMVNKECLGEIRSNRHVKASNLWFFKEGMKAVKRFYRGKIPEDIEEYKLWWLISTAALLQDLWQRWESYLYEEIRMQISCAHNRCIWYTEDGDDLDYSDDEMDGDYWR
jgi:hypothetical protein